MRIAVIGAGAMGSLFGGLLAESGADVELIDIWADHVRTINEHGLVIEREGLKRTVKTKAVTDSSAIEPVELAIVFVKSTQTATAAETAGQIVRPGGAVLTLQNGLGNADVIAESVSGAQVLAGTTAHGATMLGPGQIRHAGIGPTVIGRWGGGDDVLARNIADLFSRAGIETKVSADIRPVIWDKLLVNVGINAMTALTGVKNGQLLDLEVTRNLMAAAVEEALAVARAQGIKVRDDAVEHVYQVAKATGANRSSMGQDVDHKRRTEIHTINGAVVREAAKVGLSAPVNRTLAALIETLQAHYK